MWAHNGRELFFVDPVTGQLQVAEFSATADAFERGRITTLFSVADISGSILLGREDRVYDVSPDDQRFLMTRPIGAEEGGERSASVILVQNFFEELKARVPTSG